MTDETEARWQRLKSIVADLRQQYPSAVDRVKLYSINWDDGASLVAGQRGLATVVAGMNTTANTSHHVHALSGVKSTFDVADAKSLDHQYQQFMFYHKGRHQPFYDSKVQTHVTVLTYEGPCVPTCTHRVRQLHVVQRLTAIHRCALVRERQRVGIRQGLAR